ncbi:hypothetical protein V6N13_147422 [Hibiscus sabdariffa]
MNLRGHLRTFLVEVKPALPTAVAPTQHLFLTGSAVVSGVAWTADVFVEYQWMVMTPSFQLPVLFSHLEISSPSQRLAHGNC